MPRPLAILYVGTLNPGGTCLQRLRELEEMGHHVTAIDTVPGPIADRRSSLAWRVRNRLLGAIDESRANQRLLALPAAPAPGLVWIDKGVTIERSTLLALRARWSDALFLAYSGDDMFNPRNQSRQWRDCLPEYDLHVTTKSFNVSELLAAGARDAFFIGKGFSPAVHHPREVTPDTIRRFGGDVGFVGWPESARERSMRRLAAAGIPVRVWGPWERWRSRPNLLVEGRPLWDGEYAAALSSFRINLGFLRRVNRDRHTTRSIEIPACGGFLLAERTDEHLALFREGAEAEFFSDDDELIAKCRHYLAREQDRLRIAAAGLRRCHEGGYSNVHRLAAILDRALGRRAMAA